MVVLKRTNLVPMLVLVLLLLTIWLLGPFLVTIFLAAILAYLCFPLKKLLQRGIRNETIVSLIVCVIVVLVVMAVASYVVGTLVYQSSGFLQQVKELNGLFRGCSYSWCSSLTRLIQQPEVREQVLGVAKVVPAWLLEKGSAVLLRIPAIVIHIFVLFAMMFYFLRDGEYGIRALTAYLRRTDPRLERVVVRFKEIFHGIVYGNILVAIIQGIAGGIGFLLFGIPSPLFWGVIMGFLALIPYLGTGIAWVPASLYLIVMGLISESSLLVKGIGLFAYGLIVIAGIDNVLKPKLISEKAKVHSALIMLGIFGGIAAIGPIGVLVGPLVLALLAVVINVYVRKG